MDIDQIIEVLHIALEDKREARRMISDFILSAMSSDALEYAVKNNVDPWDTIIKKYHIYVFNPETGGYKETPVLALLLRGLLREYWDGRDGIGGTLTDVRKVYNRLARNPVNQEILKRPETVNWLNRAVTRAYDGIYTFTWES